MWYMHYVAYLFGQKYNVEMTVKKNNFRENAKNHHEIDLSMFLLPIMAVGSNVQVITN